MRCSSREQPLTQSGERALAPDRVRLVLLVIVLAGLGLAVWLRLAPIFADFAFGDGGLFWVMANDLRDNGFVPPDVTTYNTGDIPWVYPPIGIYLVALLGGGLDLFRILPASGRSHAAGVLAPRESTHRRTGRARGAGRLRPGGSGVRRFDRRRRGHARARTPPCAPHDVGTWCAAMPSGRACSAA